ncbi:MAG: hypothetical protein R3C53_20040 [Pirellulaceae bacterium]
MSRSARDVLDQEFLTTRAKLLEIAAFFDRLDSAQAAEESQAVDERQLQLLQQGCQILTDAESDKAARLQLLFSREYDSDWRSVFGI